jgi:hypothetical protein
LRFAINRRDTPALYDWLISALSYQGISDRVAYEYMERHGYVTWSDLEKKLRQGLSCPRLASYWHFHGCASGGRGCKRVLASKSRAMNSVPIFRPSRRTLPRA